MPTKITCKFLEEHILRPLAALLEGLLDPLGGGLDLGRFQKSNRPSVREGSGPWTFHKVQPTLWKGGGWTLDFSESPTDPLGGGGWTLDFQKERIHALGGGVQSVAPITPPFQNSNPSVYVKVVAHFRKETHCAPRRRDCARIPSRIRA